MGIISLHISVNAEILFLHSWAGGIMNNLTTNPKGSSPLPSRSGGGRPSQRAMLSLLMLLLSIGALTFALLGGAKLVLDIFSVGLANSLSGNSTKAIVIVLAYGVGWLGAMVDIRVYGNLVLPFIINIFIWGCLIGICSLYVLILQRLYIQAYDLPRFIAYLAIMTAALAAMIGLHFIIEGYDLRPLALPLLIINLIQLGLIVLRYVFTADAKSVYLINDLIFFGAMAAFSVFMLAHIGLLAPFRRRLTNYFDRNSKAIRTDDYE